MKKMRTLYKLYGAEDYFGIVERLVKQLFPSRLVFVGKCYIVSSGSLGIKLRREPKGVKFRKAGISDLNSLIACDKQLHRKLLFEKYFKENRECFLVEKNEKVIAYGWGAKDIDALTFDGYCRHNVSVRMGEGTIMLGDGYIEEASRMKGYFPYLLKNMMGYLAKHSGRTRFIAHIYSSNLNSLSSHKRLGFDVETTFVYVYIFGFRLLYKFSSSGRKIIWLNKQTVVKL